MSRAGAFDSPDVSDPSLTRLRPVSIVRAEHEAWDERNQRFLLMWLRCVLHSFLPYGSVRYVGGSEFGSCRLRMGHLWVMTDGSMGGFIQQESRV